MSYFEHMRSMHPLRAGDTRDGKLVTRTCYAANGHPGEEVAVFMLDGECSYRRCDTGEFYLTTSSHEQGL